MLNLDLVCSGFRGVHRLGKVPEVNFGFQNCYFRSRLALTKKIGDYDCNYESTNCWTVNSSQRFPMVRWHHRFRTDFRSLNFLRNSSPNFWKFVRIFYRHRSRASIASFANLTFWISSSTFFRKKTNFSFTQKNSNFFVSVYVENKLYFNLFLFRFMFSVQLVSKRTRL